MSFIIYAPNIHQGGGKSLLLGLLNSLNQPATVFLDKRLQPIPILPDLIKIKLVTPKLISRLQAELELQIISKTGDTLLCFGNLPPLFRNRARVFTYLQNRYLCKPVPLKGLSTRTKLRICIERIWLRYFARDSTILVQSKSMAADVHSYLGRTSRVMPFMPETTLSPSRGIYKSKLDSAEKLYDFVYVASGEAHKNHLKLLEAWKMLANLGVYPSLCLTLNTKSDEKLLAVVNQLSMNFSLKIINKPTPQNQINELYEQSCALIYPSLFESYGLPLLEANILGLPILASEQDFVRDVVVPEESFNPDSPLSIARAVKRYLKLERTPAEILSPDNFLSQILESK